MRVNKPFQLVKIAIALLTACGSPIEAISSYDMNENSDIAIEAHKVQITIPTNLASTVFWCTSDYVPSPPPLAIYGHKYTSRCFDKYSRHEYCVARLSFDAPPEWKQGEPVIVTIRHMWQLPQLDNGSHFIKTDARIDFRWNFSQPLSVIKLPESSDVKVITTSYNMILNGNILALTSEMSCLGKEFAETKSWNLQWFWLIDSITIAQ